MSPSLIGAWAVAMPAPSVSRRAVAGRDRRRDARMRNLLVDRVALSKTDARKVSRRFSALDREHSRVVSSGASGDCFGRKAGNEAAGGGGGPAPAGSAARAAPHPARPRREDRALLTPPLPARAGPRLPLDRQPDAPHPHRRHRPRPALPGRVRAHPPPPPTA